MQMEALAQQTLFTGGALLCAGIGSVQDVRERRIPNFITGPAIAFGLMLHLAAGGWAGFGHAAVAGLLGGGIFFVVYLAGGMGGGDVKLMAAVGCIAGLPHLGLIVLGTVISGGVFALGVALYNGRLRETALNTVALVAHHTQAGFRPHPELNLTNIRTLRLPYALPIAAGCLLAFSAAIAEARL
jgi:prepilin peptidase CpaA